MSSILASKDNRNHLNQIRMIISPCMSHALFPATKLQFTSANHRDRTELKIDDPIQI